MSEDRSHAPTPRRRRLAREQGHVPRSQELASSVVFLGAIAAVVVCAPRLVTMLVSLLRQQLSFPGLGQDDVASHTTKLQSIGTEALTSLLPVLGLICCTALVVHLSQTGLLWLPQNAMPDFRRIHPAQGLQRMMSPSQLTRLLLQLLKIVAMVAVGAALLKHSLPNLMRLAAESPEGLLHRGTGLLIQFAAAIGAVLLLFGGLDYLLQRLKHERDLQMSPDELREEIRAVQNDVSLSRRRSMPNTTDRTPPEVGRR